MIKWQILLCIFYYSEKMQVLLALKKYSIHFLKDLCLFTKQKQRKQE